MAPRRALTPLAALMVLLFVYLAQGAVGASVVDRYLIGAATLLLPFCAVSIGGWSMLVPGSALRRVWIVAALALVVYGTFDVVRTFSITSLRTTSPTTRNFTRASPPRSPPLRSGSSCAAARCSRSRTTS